MDLVFFIFLSYIFLFGVLHFSVLYYSIFAHISYKEHLNET